MRERRLSALGFVGGRFGGGLHQLLTTVLVPTSHSVSRQRVRLVLAADNRAKLTRDGVRETVVGEQSVTQQLGARRPIASFHAQTTLHRKGSVTMTIETSTKIHNNLPTRH